jgi:hypothetical protein
MMNGEQEMKSGKIKINRFLWHHQAYVYICIFIKSQKKVTRTTSHQPHRIS